MRIAVVGAGIAGLTVAFAAARIAGAETVVYERHERIRPGIGLAVNVAPNGMRVLDQLGLAGQVIDQGCVLRTWEMGCSDGRIIARFPLRFERDFGYPMVAIRRELLIEILHRAAIGAGVGLRFGREVTGVEQRTGGASITFGDGTAEFADVVAACDGTHSKIKQQLCGSRPAVPTGQGQSFGISRPGGDLAQMKDTFSTRLGSGGYFGGFDIGHGEVLWYVGYNIGRRVRALGASRDLTADYPLPVVRRFTTGWDPPVPQVIERTVSFGGRASDDQSPPRTIADGRVVLLGDASHPVQIFFGQGASLALEDAFTLARLLEERSRLGNSDGVDRALAAYARIRLPRRVAVAEYSRQLGIRYHWTNPAKCWVRNRYLRRLGAGILDSAAWIYGDDQHPAPVVRHS